MSQRKGATGGKGRTPKKFPMGQLSRMTMRFYEPSPYQTQLEKIRRPQEVSP